jgi:hypothetical protein
MLNVSIYWPKTTITIKTNTDSILQVSKGVDGEIHVGKTKCVRFQVLTAASMKMAVFWVAALCSLEEVYQRFALTLKAASTSETFINIY